jgi:hypothetical protein
MKNFKKTIPLLILVSILVFIFGALMNRTRLTYIEIENLNTSHDYHIAVDNPETELVQQFISPYEILHGIGVLIETYARDNNSEWVATVVDCNSGDIVFEKRFNATQIPDDSYYLIQPLNQKNVRLVKGGLYELHIKADKVNTNTSIAFYASAGSKINDADFKVNGSVQDSDLYIKILGGDFDWWWNGFWGLCVIFLFLIGLRYSFITQKRIRVRDDLLLQSMIVATISFLLISSFAYDVDGFIDELDNFRGGMVIARGGVLYKDYITQHTPITYYICSIFALFGAGSMAQFRLSFYLLQSLIWGGLYFRHAEHFGKIKMFILPILDVVFVTSIFPYQGCMVLSDRVQGISFVALMLEYLRYLKDKQLGISRSLIIVTSIFVSFGAAFLSVFPLFCLAILVFIREVLYWRENKISIKLLFSRYAGLVLTTLILLILVFVYFWINDAIQIAYEQSFKFNLEVYPYYIGGFGANKIQPFINAFQNFFNVFKNGVIEILASRATGMGILQLILITAATACLFNLLQKKKYFEALGLFFAMCFSATRGYDFHSIAALHVACLIIAVNFDSLLRLLKKVAVPILGLIAVFVLSVYIEAVGNNLLAKQPIISDMENRAVTDTNTGDEIFFDAWICDSLYLLYKDRYPVNSCIYFLPWYVDWYEQQSIDELNEAMPKVVLYNEHSEVWGYSDFSRDFAIALKQNYKRLSDDENSGWPYNYWIRK